MLLIIERVMISYKPDHDGKPKIRIYDNLLCTTEDIQLGQKKLNEFVNAHHKRFSNLKYYPESEIVQHHIEINEHTIAGMTIDNVCHENTDMITIPIEMAYVAIKNKDACIHSTGHLYREKKMYLMCSVKPKIK